MTRPLSILIAVLAFLILAFAGGCRWIAAQ
jgi:hypothetical protein